MGAFRRKQPPLVQTQLFAVPLFAARPSDQAKLHHQTLASECMLAPKLLLSNELLRYLLLLYTSTPSLRRPQCTLIMAGKAGTQSRSPQLSNLERVWQQPMTVLVLGSVRNFKFNTQYTPVAANERRPLFNALNKTVTRTAKKYISNRTLQTCERVRAWPLIIQLISTDQTLRESPRIFTIIRSSAHRADSMRSDLLCRRTIHDQLPSGLRGTACAAQTWKFVISR